MLPIRLGAMLREDSRTLVGIVLAVVATAAGCSGGSDKAAREETSSPVTIKATPAETTKAIRCLHAAGLSSADQGHSGLWTGSHQSPAYRIVVHKLAKPVKAPRVVAGEYAVTGSFKVVAVGRGLIGNDGIQADALVQTVAECLSS
jgi:hypothetical protein